MDASPWSAEGAGPAEVTPRFHGSAGTMGPIVVKGLVLSLVTLGVYRFWYTTDIRRFLWNATEIGGDGVEYLGRGVELFIGFLIALAVVIPIYAAIAMVSLFAGPEAGAAIQTAASLAIFVLAQYAMFRARRYRLTRTVWRGVRLQQTGSGWAYAGRSIGWGVLAVMTLGLAYPAMRASLERYKMGNTWYGDQQAAFEGAAWTLFRRGFPLWLIALVCVAGSIAAANAVVAWREQMGASPGDVVAPVAVVGAGVVVTFAIAVLAPIYQAIEFRWWADGCRFGGTRARATLGLTAFLRVYLVFFLVLILSGAAFAGVGAAILSAFRSQFAAGEPGSVAVMLGVLFYFVGAILVAALWQMFVVRPVWKKSFEGVVLVNLAALSAAQSTTPPASAFGEGVVDAIDFGGF